MDLKIFTKSGFKNVKLKKQTKLRCASVFTSVDDKTQEAFKCICKRKIFGQKMQI